MGMLIQKKFAFFDVFVYIFSAVCGFLLGYIGNQGEPFGLALLFACGCVKLTLTPCIVGLSLFAISQTNTDEP